MGWVAQMRLKTHHAWIALGALFAFHVVVNAAWIHQDLSLRSFDGGPHMEAAAHAAYLIQQAGLKGALQVARGVDAHAWPSAGYLPWALLAQVFPPSLSSLRLFNLLYLALLLLSTFLIGRRLLSTRAGLLAAALVSLYPKIYGEGRQFGADFPGAALCALCVYLLLRTDRFTRWGGSLIFGAAAGLSLLVRPQISFFLVWPALLLLASSMLHPGPLSRARVLGNSLLSMVAAALASAVWWQGREVKIWQQLQQHRHDLPDHFLVSGTADPSALYYLKALPLCFSLFLLVVAGVALAGLYRGGRPRPSLSAAFSDPRALLVGVWILGGFTLLSLFEVRSLRYLMPLCAPMALISAHGLLSIPHTLSRRAIILITLMVGSSTMLADSFFSRGLYPADQSEVHRITSGPPRTDPLIASAYKVSAFLRTRHCQACGLEIFMGSEEIFNGHSWFLAPVLRLTLPGIKIREGATPGYSPHRPGGGEYIGDTALPAAACPSRHCYQIKYADADHPLTASQQRRLERGGLQQVLSIKPEPGLSLSLWYGAASPGEDPCDPER